MLRTVSHRYFAPVASSTPAPPPQAGSSIAHLRYGGTPGPQSQLPSYGTIFLSMYRTDDVTYVQNINPNVLVLPYEDPTSFTSGDTSPPPPFSWNSPISYEEALAHDNANPGDKWIVRDVNGNPMHDRGYTTDFFADVGAVSYQNAVKTRIVSNLQSQPTNPDGVFFDQIMNIYLYRTVGGPTAPTQGYIQGGVVLTDTLYQTRMKSFIDNVGPYVKGQGYYVCTNSGYPGDNDGSQTNSWWDLIYPSVNGVLQEYWIGAPDGIDFFNGPGDWHGHYNSWLSIMDTAQGHGLDFYGGGHGLGSDTTSQAYGKAAFLLKWNGFGGGYYWSNDDGGDPWHTSYTTPIGFPSADMFAVGTGWRRNFSSGTVCVNPNASGGGNINFALGANYKRPDNVVVSSVTLTPTTAMILTGPF